jgi:hypothetical protein
MTEYNPFDGEGRVKDVELARKAAEAQDRVMDSEKSVVPGFITKKGEQAYRTQLGEQDAERVLNSAIETKNIELREAEWKEVFENVTEIGFSANSYQPAESTVTYMNGETSERSQLSYLIQKGLIQPELLLEIFEVGIKGGNPSFTGNLKEGWKEKLEGALSKKIISKE